MTDNELLLAMSNLIQTQIEPLKRGMEHMGQELKETKQEIRDVKQEIREVKQKQQQTSIILENDILPRLQNIEACYTSTYQRYADGVGNLEALEMNMNIVQKVVAEHSEKLQKIS